MKNPNWKLREKVIAILEQHIDSSASIQHDIDLPVLKSNSGRTRQCDVVITQGQIPRQTISIVEVQNRSSKPDINTFNGWVEKKNEVGAQHLLCISDMGFPDSILERAEELGPTIRLLTFKQLEEKGWPIPKSYFSEKFKRVRYDNLLGLKFEHIHPVRMNTKKANAALNPFEKIIFFDNGDQISVTDLMDAHFFKTDIHIDELPIKENISLKVIFEWPLESAPSMMTDYQDLIKIKWLEVSFLLSIFEDTVNWKTESYAQYKWGELAWCITGKSENGAHFIMPLHQASPGNYSPGRLISLGDESMQVFLSADSIGYKATKFDL